MPQLCSGETFYLFVNDRSYHENFKNNSTIEQIPLKRAIN